MLEEHAARNADLSEIQQLKQRENSIIDAIAKNDGTQKQLIIELAESYERRLDLGDQTCTFLINQISTQIRRDLLSLQPPPAIAPYVHEYLPEKYKSTAHAEAAKLAKHISNRMVEPYDPTEQSSSAEIEIGYEQDAELINELDIQRKKAIDRELRRERIALERGLKLGGNKFRYPISFHDFNSTQPVPKTLEDKIEDVAANVRFAADAQYKFADLWMEDPLRLPEQVEQCLKASETWREFWRPFNDIKFSGDYIHWYDRGYLEDMGGKHRSGNSNKYPSILCSNCSSNLKEDHRDYEVMWEDSTSPTGLRCRNCKGTQVIGRQVTREEVGDRLAEVYNEAKNMALHLPAMEKLFHFYMDKKIHPKENARKLVISPLFSDSSIAGISTKVIK